MDQIKNIIFDIGGILLDYRWRDLLADHGFPKDRINTAGLEIINHPYWKEMDRGILSEAEIMDKYCEEFPNDKDMIQCLFSNRFAMALPRPRLYKEIEKLFDKSYRIFLLSNYSAQFFAEQTVLIPFMDRLDGMIVSCRIHLMKPEKEIYQALFDTYGLSPSECFFVDDNADNIAAANAMGMHAYVAKTEEDVIELIKPFQVAERG